MPALYDLAPTIFAVTVVSIVLSTFFTACRITVRFRHRNMQVDDWFALVGQVGPLIHILRVSQPTS